MSYQLHRDDCPALCQGFSGDPAGRIAAWVKTCKCRGANGTEAGCHVCTCDGKEKFLGVIKDVQSLGLAIEKANEHIDEGLSTLLRMTT